MNARFDAGRILSMGGYFTHARHLRAQGADALERSLGYRKGRLAEGWWMLFLQQMPTPDQFEVRDGATIAAAAERSHARPGDTAAGEGRPEPGVKVYSLKSRTLKDTFFLNGPGRLAKLVPAAPPLGEPEQSPTGGIPQFALTVPLPFRVVCFVAPGSTYTGDYV